MTQRMIAYMIAGWFAALTLTTLACLWPDPSQYRNGIMQWAIPILMAASILLFAGIGVWRNLNRPAVIADTKGAFPSDIALHLISKWGMRW